MNEAVRLTQLQSLASQQVAAGEQTGAIDPALLAFLIQRAQGHDADVVAVNARVDALPGGGVTSVDWTQVLNKPATFPPAAHTHPQSEVTGLVVALTAKADTTALAAKADTSALSSYQPTSARGQANGYASLDATGKVPAAQLPAAAANPLTVRIDADLAASTVVTLANTTGLAFNVLNGVTYRFVFYVVFRSAALTTGIKLAVTTPTFTVLAGNISSVVAADGVAAMWVGAVTTSADPVISSGVQAITTDYMAVIEGVIVPSANGIVQVQHATEVAASAVTVRRGSHGYLYTV